MAACVVAAGSEIPFQEGLGEKVGGDEQCIVAPYVQCSEHTSYTAGDRFKVLSEWVMCAAGGC